MYYFNLFHATNDVSANAALNQKLFKEFETDNVVEYLNHLASNGLNLSKLNSDTKIMVMKKPIMKIY